MRTYSPLLTVMALIIGLMSCSNNTLDASHDTAVAVIPKLQFQNGDQPTSPDSVATIVITVIYGATTIRDTFDYAAHGGTLSSKIPPNTPFTLRIEGIDNTGTVIYHGEQEYSGSDQNIRITITANQVTPKSPDSLWVTSHSSTQTILQWKDNSSNELGFIIARSSDNGTTFTTIDTVGKDKAAALDKVTPNTIYLYSLVAYNAAGVSSESTMRFDPKEVAPKPNKPRGDTEIDAGEAHYYMTDADTCGNGHALEYRFSWGDRAQTGWLASPAASHSWVKSGSYSVQAQTRCSKNTRIVSPWSDALTVKVLDNSQ